MNGVGRPVRRRKMLTLAGGSAVMLALAACGAPGAAPAGNTGTGTGAGTGAQSNAPKPTTAAAAQSATKPGQYKEAPALADLVKAGKLPPVEQRVSGSPLVLKPVEKVGQYGGIWRMTTTGRADTAWFTRTVGYDGLVRWSPDWSGVIPDLAEKWEVSPDAKEYTFHLRPGVKWSDGKPVTPDDYIFTLEDVFKNKALTPVFPSWLSAGGKAPTIQKLNDTTFKYVFEAPHGMLLKLLATPSGLNIVMPAHYAKQYHTKYASSGDAIQSEVAKRQKQLEDEAKKRNLTPDWATLFAIMTDAWFTPDRPTLYAWKVTQGIGTGQVVKFERNPYYWKVDTAGNQLPYIDQLQFEQHERQDTMVLKALNGEIDFQDRHINALSNKSVFVDGQQKGNFHLTVETGGGGEAVALNLTHKDPEMRKIFQDHRFREALSHAINRKEVIDVVYVSQGNPMQVAPAKDSPYYNEKLATQYLDYDVKKGNQLLDDMGLTKKDASGMRLRLDGQPLLIGFEVASSTGGGGEQVDFIQMVKKYWAAVGVNMEPKVEDRSIFYTRKDANDTDATIWGGGNEPGMTTILDPRWYFPFSHESNFAEAWVLWYQSNGKDGEEPPEAPKKQMDLYQQVLQTGDEKKQLDLMKQILDIAQQQFYVIGLKDGTPGYGVQRNDFFNVPKTMIGSWQYPTPGPANPPQFFTTRKP